MAQILRKNPTLHGINLLTSMRLTYILHNQDGCGRRVPRGQAWQWIHEVKSFEQLKLILDWINTRASVDRLNLMNVYLDHTAITSESYRAFNFEFKQKIVYSHTNSPHRIILMDSEPVQAMTVQNPTSHGSPMTHFSQP